MSTVCFMTLKLFQKEEKSLESHIQNEFKMKG